MMLPLAELLMRRNLSHAQRWFSRSDPTILHQIALVLMLLGLGLFAGWVFLQVQRRRAAPVQDNPAALFSHMQRKLGLSMLERWQLWRLAKGVKLRHPTALLISPPLFDEAVQKYAGKAGAGELGRIRAKLFAQK